MLRDRRVCPCVPFLLRKRDLATHPAVARRCALSVVPACWKHARVSLLINVYVYVCVHVVCVPNNNDDDDDDDWMMATPGRVRYLPWCSIWKTQSRNPVA